MRMSSKDAGLFSKNRAMAMLSKNVLDSSRIHQSVHVYKYKDSYRKFGV